MDSCSGLNNPMAFDDKVRRMKESLLGVLATVVTACASPQEKAAELVSRADEAALHGRASEAQDLYGQALALEPSFPAATIGRAKLVASTDSRAALALLAACRGPLCDAQVPALAGQILGRELVGAGNHPEIVRDAIAAVGPKGFENDPCIAWRAIEAAMAFPAADREAFAAAARGVLSRMGPAPAMNDREMVVSGKRMAYTNGGVAADNETCDEATRDEAKAESEFLALRLGTVDQWGAPENTGVMLGKDERHRFFVHGLLEERLSLRMARAVLTEARRQPLRTSADVDSFVAYVEKSGQRRGCALFELVTRIPRLPASSRASIVIAAQVRVTEFKKKAEALAAIPGAAESSVPREVQRTAERIIGASEDCLDLLLNLRQMTDVEDRASLGSDKEPGSEKAREAREERLVAYLLEKKLDRLRGTKRR
jgi:hypothetical protein